MFFARCEHAVFCLQPIEDFTDRLGPSGFCGGNAASKSGIERGKTGLSLLDHMGMLGQHLAHAHSGHGSAVIAAASWPTASASESWRPRRMKLMRSVLMSETRRRPRNTRPL